LKGKFLPLFKLNQFENPYELAEQIEYLLEDDRFLCPVENYQVRTESLELPPGLPKIPLKLKKKTGLQSSLLRSGTGSNNVY
jgi:hypothetical protein